MNSDLFMGIDIGTSGIRAALFDIDGREAGYYHVEYAALYDIPGRLEIDPDTAFDCVIKVVAGCMEKHGIKSGNVRAIGLSSQLHSLMAIDRDGKPLTGIITWGDTRAKAEADYISRNFDCGELYNKTGCRVQHPLYPLSKILWIRNNEPNIYVNTYKFVTIREYILLKLYDVDVIDITDASACGYFNTHKLDWDDDILQEVLGIEREKLGEPVECTLVLKSMKHEYARAMGIDRDTPLSVGSGDGIVANLGCGVFDDSSMSSTVGTSGAMRIAVNKPLLDSQQRTWCYCFTKDTWVAGGAVNNGGIVLRWLRDEFRQQFEAEADTLNIKSLYALFDTYAKEIKPGCDGLFFLPYLTGERSPDWNAKAKGTIHGLTLSHGKKHIVRAAMEGVMYRMFSVFQAINGINDNVKRIVANGGYTRSDIWMQIQADIFNKDITVAGIGEATVFGAAYLSMYAAGAVKDLKTVLPQMKPLRIIKPVPENHMIYMKTYQRAMDLYSAVKEDSEIYR